MQIRKLKISINGEVATNKSLHFIIFASLQSRIYTRNLLNLFKLKIRELLCYFRFARQGFLNFHLHFIIINQNQQ